jgi:hypothetical protein
MLPFQMSNFETLTRCLRVLISLALLAYAFLFINETLKDWREVVLHISVARWSRAIATEESTIYIYTDHSR